MGLLAIGLVLSALIVSMRQPSSTIVPPAHFVVPLSSATPLGGLDFPSAVISPDGSRVVYVASRGGMTQLFQRFLKSVDPVPIAGTTNAVGPFFSPDGQWSRSSPTGNSRRSILNAAPSVCEAPVGLGGSWAWLSPSQPAPVQAVTCARQRGHTAAPYDARCRARRIQPLAQWLPDGDWSCSPSASGAGATRKSWLSPSRPESGRRSSNESPLRVDGSLLYAQNGRIMRATLDGEPRAQRISRRGARERPQRADGAVDGAWAPPSSSQGVSSGASCPWVGTGPAPHLPPRPVRHFPSVTGWAGGYRCHRSADTRLWLTTSPGCNDASHVRCGRYVPNLTQTSTRVPPRRGSAC